MFSSEKHQQRTAAHAFSMIRLSAAWMVLATLAIPANATQATEVLLGLGLPTQARVLNLSGRVTLQVPKAGAPIAWGGPVTLTVGKVTDPEAAAKVPLVELIPANTPIPPVPTKTKKDGNILDDVGTFFERLFD